MAVGQYRFIHYSPTNSVYTNYNKSMQYCFELFDFIKSKIKDVPITSNRVTDVNSQYTFANAYTNGWIPAWVNTIGTPPNPFGTFTYVGYIEIQLNPTKFNLGMLLSNDTNGHPRITIYYKDSSGNFILNLWTETYDAGTYTIYRFDFILVEKKNEYFLINAVSSTNRYYNSSGYGYCYGYLGYLHCDIPIVSNDDFYIRFTGQSYAGTGSSSYMRFSNPYSNEDVSIQPIGYFERCIIETDSFFNNLYVNKIPMYPLVFGTPILGVRGRTSHIYCLPPSYQLETTVPQIYKLDGINYFNLPDFSDRIISNGGNYNTSLIKL